MRKNSIAFLFCLSLCVIILVIYRSIPQSSYSIAQAQPTEQTLFDLIPCYPKNYRSPSLTKKLVIRTKQYIYILAVPIYLKNSSKDLQELIFERDIIKKSCKQHDFVDRPFADFIPEKAAIEFKEQRWRRLLQQMGTKKFEDLLNTPPEIPEPFFLYKEDVEAIARLGFKPGAKAKVIESQRDLDYLYDLGR